MSETAPGSETAEQRTRRRWITLAEFVAVAGLMIGVATLYLNWSDRREDQVAKAQESVIAGKARGIVTLTGKADGDTIALLDAAHDFSAATVRFPAALGIQPQDALPGPHIDADWFAAALLKRTDRGPDDRAGRLPVLISVSWWDGDAKRTDAALYDVLWRTEGRLLRGRKLVLTGLVLTDRHGSPAALDAAWRRQPASR